MAIDKVMHDAEMVETPERIERRWALARGGACLFCGEWIEAGTEGAYDVLVSNASSEAVYVCHAECLSRVTHPSVAPPP